MPDGLTSFNPLSFAAQAVGGLLSTAIGIGQRSQAKKWLKNNPQPIEGMPREILEGQQIANNMANTGLPSEQYNRAMSNIRQQQAAALNAAVDRRGVLSALPYLTRQTSSSIADLDARDSAQRLTNQQYAIGVSNNVANIKRDLFEKNVRSPYMMKRQEMMQQLGAGNQNLTGGVDRLLSAGAYGLSGFGKRGGVKAPKATGVGYGADFDNYGINW